jgi:hypothetical protein
LGAYITLPSMSDFDSAISLSMPVVLKASQPDGRRVISVQASSQHCDSEGDVILQKSLLNSAKSFLDSGTIDRDHISEIGSRYGIQNPSDYIIGKPLEVKDIGNFNTEVVLELFPSLLGATTKSQADLVWESILEDPTAWSSSIFGYPTSRGIQDVRITKSAEFPEAKRYIVHELNWKSLALTKTPINNTMEGHAQVLTMKSFAWGMRQIGSPFFEKAEAPSPIEALPVPYIPLPRNRMELKAHFYLHVMDGKCPCAGEGTLFGNSVAGFREHFFNCCGTDIDTSDIYALALMQALKRDKRS